MDKNQSLQKLIRWSLAFVWLYHGLIPKILLKHADEQQLVREAGLSEDLVIPMVYTGGAIEIALALIMILFWKHKWPYYLTIVCMIAAFLGAVVNSPQYLGAAFNPVSLNFCVIVLAILGLKLSEEAVQAEHASPKDPTAPTIPQST